MKKCIIFKIIIILSIIFLSVSCLANYTVLASTIDTDVEISNTNIKDFEGVGNTILGVVQVVGIVASVIALILIGMRYLFGSIDEKAEQKNALLYYLIGAILVFATSTIVKMAYNIIVDFGN